MAEETKQQSNECTYQKQTWVDHFVDEAGFVVQQGTAMDALHFNHIEDGIEAAHNLVAQESVDREEAETALGERIDNIVEGETKTKSAEEADKVLHSLTVGDKTFDGSEDVKVDAGDGIKIDGTTIKHTNSVTAATASGGSGAKEFGGTIDIPSVTYDKHGHVTGKSTTTVTLPSNDATQSKHGLMSADDKKKLDGMAAYKAGTGLSLSGDTFSLKTLEDMSWAEISAISKAGKAASIFHVGQEKKITLSTGESVTAVILGFNHDDLTAGGKAGITFGLKNCLKSGYNMNSSDTNSGGWTSSAMRSRMATFKGYLPSDLQTAIRTVTKKTSAGAQSTTINSTSDDLFLFSHVEVFGTNYYNQGDSPSLYSVAGEGKQYEYYKGKTWCSYYKKTTVDSFGTARDYTANRYYQENSYKGMGDTATSASIWWLRSPYASYSSTFCCVSTSGGVSSNNASNSYGVCFGFCL